MTERTSSRPTAGIVEGLSRAVYPFSAMLTGMRLGVFAALKDGPMTAEEIAKVLGVRPRKLERLLYALVATRLLTMKDDVFCNSAEADQLLVPDSPDYIGDDPHINSLLLWGWGALDKTAESIRTGKPQMKFDPSTLSEEELEWGFRGTRSVAFRAGRLLAERYDFSSFRTALDVGGGSGGLAAALAEACPHLEVTVVDLPQVVPITQRLLKESGAQDRVEVVGSDVVHAQLIGSFDVAVARALIQVLPPDQADHALRNISKAINPGGRAYILGHILDDSRTSPPEEVGYRLGALNFYDHPGPYTEHEHRNWLMAAGFEEIERDRLPNGDGVMCAQKPRQAQASHRTRPRQRDTRGDQHYLSVSGQVVAQKRIPT